MEKLQAFYRRVHPPGFWGPIARSLGEASADPVRRFNRALGAIVSCVLSVYLLLIGIGKLMLNFDGWVLTWPPVVSIVLGVCLIPVWWKLGMNHRDKPPGFFDSKKPPTASA